MARSIKAIINGIHFDAERVTSSTEEFELFFKGQCGTEEKFELNTSDIFKLHKLLGIFHRKESKDFGLTLRSSVDRSSLSIRWTEDNNIEFDLNDEGGQLFTYAELTLIIYWLESVMKTFEIKYKSLLSKAQQDKAVEQMPVVFADPSSIVANDVQCFVEKTTDDDLKLQLEDEHNDLEYNFTRSQLVDFADYLQGYVERNNLRPKPKAKPKKAKAKAKPKAKKPVRRTPPKGVSPAALAS